MDKDNPNDGKQDWIDKLLGTVHRIGNKGFYITSGAAMMGVYLLYVLFFKILPQTSWWPF